MNEWMNKWMSEWMNEWMNERNDIGFLMKEICKCEGPLAFRLSKSDFGIYYSFKICDWET
jgi:hypothetical protein